LLPLYWAITLAMIVVLLIAPQFVKSSVLDPIHALASPASVPMRNPANDCYYPFVTLGWNYEMFFTGLSLIGVIIKPPGALGVYTAPLMMEFVFGMVVAALLASAPGYRNASPLILVALLAVRDPGCNDYLHSIDN
jgi:exopolysaccharide production protein ExoZ